MEKVDGEWQAFDEWEDFVHVAGIDVRDSEQVERMVYSYRAFFPSSCINIFAMKAQESGAGELHRFSVSDTTVRKVQPFHCAVDDAALAQV